MNSITNERETIVFPNVPHDLGDLPLDLFELIFSKLNPMHTEQFPPVSKAWNLKCIEIKKNQFLLLKPFIDWLNLNLDEKYTDQKNKLLACYDISKGFKCITKQIQAVLQELDSGTLMDLQNLSIKGEKPKFFIDLLHIAGVDKSLKSIFQQISNPNVPRNIYAMTQNLNTLNYSRNIFCQSTSGELVQKGFFYKSIEVANMITSDREKDYALIFICRELFRDRLFDQTKNLLLKISDKSVRNKIAQNFIAILTKHDEREVARNYMTMLFY